jgi:cell division cycle 2-like protein
MFSEPDTSNKRSKWEIVGYEDDQQAYKPQPKRRLKPKFIRAALPATTDDDQSRPASPSSSSTSALSKHGARLLHSRYAPPRIRHPPIQPSRSVFSYEKLNQIEEGSYGVVFRARDKQTGDIVALKKLKLEEEKNGFPITALREIYALMTCRHENVVGIREVVVGDTLTQCVSSLSTFFKSLCNHINLSTFGSLNWLLDFFFFPKPVCGKGSSLLWTSSNTTSKPC